jgi:hypothetical protein
MSYTSQDFDNAVKQLPELDKKINAFLNSRVDQSEVVESFVRQIVEGLNESNRTQ